MSAAETASTCARAVWWGALPAIVAATIVTEISLWVAIGIALVAVTISSAVALAMADANISLLIRGKHSADAYEGKFCVVVGGSRGFGQAIAVYLARAGASVVLCARGTAQLQVLPLQLEVWMSA